ncbi:MAG: hypothetical protein AAB703_01530, partial [Pseudomonadota bacterium]
ASSSASFRLGALRRSAGASDGALSGGDDGVRRETELGLQFLERGRGAEGTHADDLARAIYAALHYAKPGRICHTCDNSHLKMGEYFDLVANHFGLPRPPRITRNQAKECISSGMFSFMKESRRLENLRMKKELHVSLSYPTVLEGIKAAQTGNQ